MGYLPIILALLGFIFLWAIVNYNSIKLKKAEAEQASKLVFQQAALRSTIIKRMANISHEDATLLQTVQRVKNSLNDYEEGQISTVEKIEAEKKVNASINDIPQDYIKDSPYSEAYHQLQIAHNNYQRVAAVYLSKVKNYEELLHRYPSKLIASAGGFKPLNQEQKS
ncbi:hypothetical protein PZB74_21210 [Porifericola rhodea]|uniref:hypothetical protein n=1 Tax=Porifericola rhodea TaxID=930972 RepID=UPI002666356B|nr:hypothetical protein [Porifericola rhodea]WKN31472.1 hypothetical protein PZB74_21210 [Porifericola rhodea]